MKLKNFMSYNSQAKDDRIVRLPFSLPSSSLSVATSLRCQNKFFFTGTYSAHVHSKRYFDNCCTEIFIVIINELDSNPAGQLPT